MAGAGGVGPGKVGGEWQRGRGMMDEEMTGVMRRAEAQSGLLARHGALNVDGGRRTC